MNAVLLATSWLRLGFRPPPPETRPQQGTVLIKLTSTQEITPYKWVHPDEAR